MLLALAVLAPAAGGAEVEPCWPALATSCPWLRSPGPASSSVFTALTQPVADFERQQAAAALPAITETATLRRIADQAAGAAEATASKAPSTNKENAKPRPSPGPPRPPTSRAAGAAVAGR